LAGYQAIEPPSTGMIDPVMKLEASVLMNYKR